MVDFVNRHKAEPFFLYWSPEAVHSFNLEAPKRLTDRTQAAPKRRKLAGAIVSVDDQVGKLLDVLKKNNLRENTLVWYCGDNGTPGDGIVTSSLRGQKATLYEGGIRVPGIIEWPQRIAAPGVSAVNSVTSDMLPTLCHLTGTALPDRPHPRVRVLQSRC